MTVADALAKNRAIYNRMTEQTEPPAKFGLLAGPGQMSGLPDRDGAAVSVQAPPPSPPLWAERSPVGGEAGLRPTVAAGVEETGPDMPDTGIRYPEVPEPAQPEPAGPLEDYLYRLERTERLSPQNMA